MVGNRSNANHRKGNQAAAYKLNGNCEILCEDTPYGNLVVLSLLYSFDESVPKAMREMKWLHTFVYCNNDEYCCSSIGLATSLCGRVVDTPHSSIKCNAGGDEEDVKRY